MAIKPHTPPKLPVKIKYEPLVSGIAKAHASLARLDAFLTQLPNPRLLSRMFITKEAVMSSQIEGTQASLIDVLEQEAKGLFNEETRAGRDIREIINYRNAMEEGIRMIKDGKKISENLMLDLHSMLLRSVRGADKKPGEFREVQVYIGKPGLGIEKASYIPPSYDKVPGLIKNLVSYMNDNDEKDLIVQAAIAHSQFEAIHPFIDGNGRIGRLLISLFLFDRALISRPYLYVSEFFEAHRPEYYARLKGVTMDNDWNGWISFFLKAIDEQARNVAKTAQDILDLYNVERANLSRFDSVYAGDLMDAIFIMPVFSSSSIRLSSNIKNKQTLFSLIDKFEHAGLIVSLTPDAKRGNIYMFKKLMEILER